MHVILVLLLIVSSLVYADASTAYITLQAGNRGVDRIDLTTGNVSMIASLPLGGLGIALTNPSTAYAMGIVGINNNNLYRVDLTNSSVSQVNNSSVAGAALDMLALAPDGTTAYIGGFHDGNLYNVNLLNGNVSRTTPSPVYSGGLAGVALNMTLQNPTIAYAVAGDNSGGVYRVDLTNGNVSQVTSIAGVTLHGISLANNSTAYITGLSSNNIYRVDLTNGDVSLATPSPIAGAGLQGIALANNTTAYTVGSNNGAVYRVDLTTGNFSEVNSTSLVPSVVGIALVLQIGTSGLTGNNLRFANYLNANAPQTTLPLLALQSDIAGALEIAAPTRNAIFTFAAQTTQLAFGQQVYGHLAQKRWSKAWRQPMQTSQTMPAQALLSRNQLFSDASDFMNLSSESLSESSSSDASGAESLPESSSSDASGADSAEKENVPEMIGKKEEAHYSPWLGAFGEYTNERSQHQTPSFDTGTGGFVLATDYRHIDIHPALLLGGGMAYAYTHVHEADGAGHANINQVALTFYGAWEEPQWYVNWALWGGYYHANNVREINLPGIVGGSAISSTNGWQLTPHFEVGYDYEDDWFSIEPFDMIDWVASWERGFQEHGAGSLNMGQNGRFCSLLRNELGIRFNETLTYDWGTVTFREKGGYVYQKAFHTGAITAFLVGSAGSFVVSTLTGAQNLGALEFESLFVPANKKYPYGTISYQGEFGSRYQSHQCMGTIGMDF